MSYEVDIRAVGEESKSGDAITLRFGNFSSPNTQTVVVIDGGYTANGDDVVEHIRACYGTDRVDAVISTHPDNDHVCGLRAVVEKLNVQALLMHRPWAVSESARQILKSARAMDSSAWSYIQKSITAAQDLEELAAKKRIPIYDPYAGVTIANTIRVVGPTQAYYASLLSQFGEPAQRMSLMDVLRKAASRVKETWDEDALVEPDPNAVSAVNNSSVILYADFGEKVFLFCADAGVPALTSAMAYAAGAGIDLSRATYVQGPHHGSKRNVGPSMLNALIGPKVPKGTTSGKYMFVSAAKGAAPTHPSKRVTNAAIRRGAAVVVTQGSNHCYHSSDVTTRPGWTNVVPMDFHAEHDEED